MNIGWILNVICIQTNLDLIQNIKYKIYCQHKTFLLIIKVQNRLKRNGNILRRRS